MPEHYLDNSATTPLCEKAKEKCAEIINSYYGNPSSLHNIGKLAEDQIEEARKIILSTFNKPGVFNKDNYLVFTSGGTEANNLAICGVALSKPRNSGKKIITTSTEHDSVLNVVKNLANKGFNVSYIDSPYGVLDIDKLINEITNDCILVSVMLVNNETGAINNINRICDLIHDKNLNVIVHCDAVQGYMKVPFDYYNKADLISISAHKLNALKGTGALYVSSNIHKLRAISPIIFGGGQEFGLRSGTENTIGIASFGSAISYFKENNQMIHTHFDTLYSYAIDKLQNLDYIKLNIPKTEKIAHHIINLTVPNIKSETLLHYLSSNDVFVSSGSACASNTNSKSHVLKSFGLSDNDIDSSIRISFGIQNTKEDVDAFICALEKGINSLQRKK